MVVYRRFDSRRICCPIQADFFKKIGKSHSSEVRRLLHRAWKMKSAVYYPDLRKRLCNSGFYRITRSNETIEWEPAFHYAEDWGRYPGYKKDKEEMNRAVQSRQIQVIDSEIELDTTTWLTLASLSFHLDAEKESPNHLFLKELFRFFLSREHPGCTVKEEKKFVLYGEAVRFDCYSEIGENKIVGEAGGVQLWKVMALIYKGYDVYVLPHWTRQKINPFIRKRLCFRMFYFKQNTQDKRRMNHTIES
ncbi:hypothetical protein P4S91_04640 [Aneurinibacillus aneurinilyticus]|uniref:hypothetical protein n=1 Tax=Aneurinibacillus aneurinilyticus TaxID=1391 RepID=UPI002E1DE2A4|nr:hypothetical protein [Aneurinibacillus aneurinilyticus]MED0722219.1 hypothetical protein [Aneurinibacillus aneurinilyticus]